MNVTKRALAAVVPVVLATGASPVAAAPPEPTTPPVLRLIDQDFAIARDAPWHAQWHVEGTVPPGSVRVDPVPTCRRPHRARRRSGG